MHSNPCNAGSCFSLQKILEERSALLREHSDGINVETGSGAKPKEE